MDEKDLEGYSGRYTDDEAVDEKAEWLRHSEDVNVHHAKPRGVQGFLAWLAEACTECVRIR